MVLGHLAHPSLNFYRGRDQKVQKLASVIDLVPFESSLFGIEQHTGYLKSKPELLLGADDQPASFPNFVQFGPPNSKTHQGKVVP